MTTWNKLLQALNQIFNSQTGAASTVKPIRRAFDNNTNEHVIWLEYRVKADVFESEDLDDRSAKQETVEPKKRKRLIDVIRQTVLRGA